MGSGWDSWEINGIGQKLQDLLPIGIPIGTLNRLRLAKCLRNCLIALQNAWFFWGYALISRGFEGVRVNRGGTIIKSGGVIRGDGKVNQR